MQQPYIHFVRDAVYVFAHALHSLLVATCGEVTRGTCPQFIEAAQTDLINHLESVNFSDVDNFPFKFEGGTHDGPPRYSIISYMENGEGFDWKEVGTYQNGTIRNLDSEFERTVRSRSVEKNFVKCDQKSCDKDEIKIPDGFNDGCCWHCQACHDNEYVKSEFECADCMVEMIRNASNPKDCILAPEIYLDYTNPWALGALFFAGTGLLMTTIASGVLWRYWNTPVVRACSRELSCVLIIGTFLSFSTTFIIVAKPSDFTCGVMRFLIGR